MQPQNVNPGNFTVDRIIYNDPNQQFAIAVGTWNDDSSVRFAMRWTGDQTDDDDLGYPKVFTHPMWFQLPIDVAPVLGAILSNMQRGNARI